MKSGGGFFGKDDPGKAECGVVFTKAAREGSRFLSRRPPGHQAVRGLLRSGSRRVRVRGGLFPGMKRGARGFLRRRFLLGRPGLHPWLCISGFAVCILRGGRLRVFRSSGFFSGRRLTVRACCRLLVFQRQGEGGD